MCLVATTKPLLLKTKSPARLVGLFFALLLSGCQTGKSPEEVIALFWHELAQGQVENARKQATQDTQQLVNAQDIDANSIATIGDS